MNVLLFGWRNAPFAALGERGRWDLAFLSEHEVCDLYHRHRAWLLAEAEVRGIVNPWAERQYRRQAP